MARREIYFLNSKVDFLLGASIHKFTFLVEKTSFLCRMMRFFRDVACFQDHFRLHELMMIPAPFFINFFHIHWNKLNLFHPHLGTQAFSLFRATQASK